MIIARRAAPVDARCRLAGYESAELPEVLAGAGAAPPVQSMDDGGGDPARLEDQARHRGRERARRAGGLAGGFGFDGARICLRHLLSDARLELPDDAGN